MSFLEDGGEGSYASRVTPVPAEMGGLWGNRTGSVGQALYYNGFIILIISYDEQKEKCQIKQQ